MIIRKGAPKINSGAPPASCTPWLLPDFFRDYPVDNLAKAGEYLFDSAEPVDGDIFALPRIMVGDDGCLCLVDVYPVADDSFVGIVRPAADLRPQEKPGNQLFVRNVERYHHIHLVGTFFHYYIKRFRLMRGTRKTIENIALAVAVRRKVLFDNTYHEFVRRSR